MLEGYDSDWIDAGTQTSATYTNIPEGKYVFKVIASNNDGVWNNTPKCFEIIITPPWWKTTFFKVFGILLFIASIYLFITMRLSLLRKQKTLLSKMVIERTTEIGRAHV